MILKNKTNLHQHIYDANGKKHPARPHRTIIVDEKTTYDKDVWEEEKVVKSTTKGE